MAKPVIAYLGTGIMGEGMIKNLQAHGFTLRLYNRTLAKAQALQNSTTKVFATPAEAVKGADIIISCVLDDEASNAVWFGPQGAVTQAKAGVICIEMSTLSIPYIEAWSMQIMQAGLKAIDCPVTGSKKGAHEASLTLFLGGKAQDIAAAQPVFSAISKQQYHFGDHGSGSKFKLLYNTLGGSILVVLAEAIGFADKLGLDKQQVVQVLSESEHSWSGAAARSKGQQIADKKHSDVAVTLDIIQKDITYALESAAHVGYTPPTALSVQKTLQEAQARGLGQLDMSAVGDIFVKE